MKNSCKTFWQVMRHFIGEERYVIIIPPLRKHDGSYGFTDYENMMVLMDLRITKT